MSRAASSAGRAATVTVTVAHAESAGRLRAATARLNRWLRQQQPVGDLTLSQWSALVSIEEHGPLRPGELAEREHVSAPTATRLAASLETVGYLARSTDAADRRSSFLSLTDSGRAALQQLRRERTAQLARRLAGLDPADLASLVDALPVLERLTRD